MGLGVWESWLTAGEQFPPPGRHRLTLEEAEAVLVGSPVFADSTTRPALWSNLLNYLGEFAAVEARHADRLVEVDRADQGVLHCLWLGGSFVSSKPSPRNIDVTVLLDAVARNSLRGLPNTRWLTEAFSRDKMLDEFGLSPLPIAYDPPASPFRAHEWSAGHRGYLSDRGLWDDFWQRTRRPGSTSPTLETAAPARGYVEVVL